MDFRSGTDRARFSSKRPALSFLPSKDNTLYQDAAGAVSNGEGIYFFAGNTKDGEIRRGLVAFDLSAIPQGATVTSVTLTLYSSKSSKPDTPVNIALRKATRDWGEGAFERWRSGWIRCARKDRRCDLAAHLL